MAEVRAENSALRSEVTELRAQLKRNSSNSSQPPSSDPPWTPRGAGPRGEGRKRGGQRGHKGHKRGFVEADEVVAFKPEQCGHCGGGLEGTDDAPYRHQVTDVPVEIRAQVIEYQVHTLPCGSCGHDTKGTLPADVPRTIVGPRLQAMLAVCTGAYRLSKRTVQELLRDFFGVTLSVGAISELEERTSEALATAQSEVAEHLATAAVSHVDETSWSKSGRAGWLWLQASNDAARFLVRGGRGMDVAKELLGSFAGMLVSDGYAGYAFVPSERRQLCWAHIARQFRGFADHGLREKMLSNKLIGVTRKVFRLWHAVRDGTISWSAFLERVVPPKDDLHRLLHEGRWMPSKKVARSCRWLEQRFESLWTFLRLRGVDPTNNHAERTLRTAVLWRKGSFGTNSARGDRFAERILTTVQTLRLQARNVLAFVADTCVAALKRTPPPRLFLQPG